MQERLARKLEEAGADFDALVKEYGLQAGEVASFERGAGGAPLGSTPELQEIVFGQPVLEEKRIGGPLVLGEDRLVIVKDLEHHKPAPRPLAEVRDQIVTAIRKERGSAAAEKAADDGRARLLSGASFDDVARELGVSAEAAHFVSRDDSATPAAIRTLVFATPRPLDKPLYRSVKLEDGGAAIVAITATRVDPAGSSAERRKARIETAIARDGGGDVAAYVNELRRKTSVSMNPKAFE